MMMTSFDFDTQNQLNLKSLLREQGLFIDFDLVVAYQKHPESVKRLREGKKQNVRL